jgi:uncharacterized protein YxjI
MLYIMKKRFFSLFGDFRVMDEFERDVFIIKRRFGFNRFAIVDMSGNEQVEVKQKILSLVWKFEIFSNNSLYATVKKPFFAFYDNYTVELFDGNIMKIEGDFLGFDYNIYSPVCGGIASVSKKLFSLTDTYGVNIVENVDDALILACVLVIEQFHSRR